MGDLSAELRFLDLEIAGKDSPYLGNGHFLAFGDIGCPADDLNGFFFSDIHGADIQFIRIGMLFACEDMADDDTLDAVPDPLHSFYLDPAAGDLFGKFFRCDT